MKLPSHLVKSRHGIFYFRLTSRRGSTTVDKRWSLHTRNPAEAKRRALIISTALLQGSASAHQVAEEFRDAQSINWTDGEQQTLGISRWRQDQKMDNIHGLLARMREVTTNNREFAAVFERLALVYLSMDPMYRKRFTEVMPWADWPQKPEFRNAGIDLIGIERGTGSLCAIQCKFNAGRQKVQAADLEEFAMVSASEPFSSRMVITNGDFGRSATELMHTCTPPIEAIGIKELESSAVDWSQFGLVATDQVEQEEPLEGKVHALTIQIGNVILTADAKDPADIEAAREMAKTLLGVSGPTIATKARTLQVSDGDVASQVEGVAPRQRNLSGVTLDELITRYATRKRDSNASKTNYEYEKMQRKFEKWLHAKKKTKPYPVRLITRNDIADFIDDLIADDVSPQTIQKKYLSALNGLFTLAQTSGAIPAGELPTRNHKLFSKADQKKAHHKSGYKSFTDEELALIFDPANLLSLEKPCDFWLPLMGLFTGGRISELCQLKVTDIKQVEGIWTLDINDEDAAQTLKTPAAMRKIPLPPQLIQIGFLDYLQMVKQYEGTIFPYIDPDKFNHYGKTPGRRFGEMLDRLKITSPSKVFHSLRSTSNNRLKQLGVSEETRCQFIGHEHDTVNSKVYSNPHTVAFLHEDVSQKLNYPHLKLDTLRFPAERQAIRLKKEMRDANKRRNVKAARAARAERNS